MQSGIVVGAGASPRTNTSATVGEACATRLATPAPLAGVAGSAEVKVVAAARSTQMDLKLNIACGEEWLVG